MSMKNPTHPVADIQDDIEEDDDRRRAGRNRAPRRVPLTHVLALPGDVPPQSDPPVTAGGDRSGSVAKFGLSRWTVCVGLSEGLPHE